MRKLVLLLVSLFLAGTLAVAQTTNSLPSDVMAANKELDHQLLEGHRLLDTDKVMGLFTSSPDIFFIAPEGELHRGFDEVRQTWKEFFASLQSIHGRLTMLSICRQAME